MRVDSLWLAVALAATLLACSEEPCVEGLTTSCATLYEPTFDNIFAKTLQPTCAAGGTACHSATGNQGGLSFVDVEQSYQALQGRVGTDPASAACSTLITRIESDDAAFQMPPGGKLSEAERCAIYRWAADGRKR